LTCNIDPKTATVRQISKPREVLRLTPRRRRRLYFFWTVVLLWWVVGWPTFWDKTTVPYSWVKQSKKNGCLDLEWYVDRQVVLERQ